MSGDDLGAVPARVHLVGGGVDSLGSGAVLAPFLQEAGARASETRRVPRLLLVLADDRGRAAEFRPGFVDALEAAAPTTLEVVDAWVSPNRLLDPVLARATDGIVVGGGPVQVYRDALLPASRAIRDAVIAGVPYLGFSAGAMLAADAALVGGWLDGGRPVCDKDRSEGLGEVRTDVGLGLVDVTVDVHASQGGLLGRALSVAGRDGAGTVVALDEGTCLSLPPGCGRDAAGEITGSGFAWVMATAGESTTVRRLGGAAPAARDH